VPEASLRVAPEVSLDVLFALPDWLRIIIFESEVEDEDEPIVVEEPEFVAGCVEVWA
jgi:hypothetical protein